jgi:hypothetical protein
MFCSFERQPLILRLYGTATEIQPDQPEWDECIGLFPPMPGARQIFDMRVDQVQTSCGYGVPFMGRCGQSQRERERERERTRVITQPLVW